MSKIAIIKLNKCDFDLTPFANKLLYKILSDSDRKSIKDGLDNYIWSVVSKYIEFVDTTTEYYVGDAVVKLTADFNRNPNDFVFHSQSSYANPKKSLELIYCQPCWSDYVQNDSNSMNKLASLFSLQHTVIENTCVLVAYEYTPDGKMTLGSVTQNDIIGVVKRRYFHSGIFIDGNRIEKFYYQNVPYAIMTLFNLNQSDSIHEINFELIGYNIKMISKPNSSDENVIATLLHGKEPIYGPVILFNMWEENIFANISLEEISKLIKVANGPLELRNISETEMMTQEVITHNQTDGSEKINKKPHIWNKFILVNNRLKKLS